MSYAKDRMIDEDEQEWKFRDDLTICAACVSQPGLKNFIDDHASEPECKFCHRRKRKAHAVPFNEFMERYMKVVSQYYGDANNETIGWDSEDQSYIGTTYDTDDIVRSELPPSNNDAVLDAIVESLADCVWCNRHPYSLTEGELYSYSWDEFSKTVKYRIRYYFDHAPKGAGWDEKIPIPEVLGELTWLIEEYGLVKTLAAGAEVFRVRDHPQKEECTALGALGPPPPESAPSNRMSAAGISVFYGATAMETALREVKANLRGRKGRAMTGAQWTTTRDLLVLDLSKLGPVAGPFEMDRYERERRRFLADFVTQITQPVKHDGREHTEYVPTQILTEYLRYRYKPPHKKPLDGIIYPSARQKKGASMVVFVSHGQLAPRKKLCSKDDVAAPLLILDERSIQRF